MTDVLHCPTCHVHLDQHEPGPCLREWAASVFGWPEHENLDDYLCRRCLQYLQLVESPCRAWQPDTRIADAWTLEPTELWLATSGVMTTIWKAKVRERIGEAPIPPLAILRAAMKARLG